MRGQRLAAALAGVLLAGAAGLIAGCGGNGNGGNLPPPHSGGTTTPAGTPTLELTPQEQEAVDEVRTLFDEFMQAYIDLATSGEPPDDEAMAPILGRIDGTLYNEINLELVNNYLEEQRLDGTLTWQLVDVAEVALDPDPSERTDPTVRLRYCIDATGWSAVRRETSEPATDAGPMLAPAVYLATVRAVRFDRGGSGDLRWYVSELDREEVGRSC